MKTHRNQSGRRLFSLRRPSGSILLRFNLLLSLLIISAAACLTSSCLTGEKVPPVVEDLNIKIDSCWFALDLSVQSGLSDKVPDVTRLDILVYDMDGIGSLESWEKYESLPDSLLIRGAKRAKTIVAIANSPRSFSRKAIERYDSIELLCYDFDEDSPERPLMSGICSLEPEKRGVLRLTPLMSKVQLCEICNTMKNYVRLENPRVYLENTNASAEILRFTGFRPSEISDNRRKQNLPYDIGIFPQHTMTDLYCYPNDSEESTPGNPHTVMVLECEITGSTCRFPVELGAVERNKTVHVDLSIEAPGLFESKVY